jgi:Zn-dependent M16 (insulinase) family peptidase
MRNKLVFRVMPNKNRMFKKSRTMTGPKPKSERNITVLLPLKEITLLSPISSNGTGLVSSSIDLDPAVLILAARLAGYQALRDEIRIDGVKAVYEPYLSASTGTGSLAMYIERDPTAAIVASYALASSQYESTTFRSWDNGTIVWRPQQPSDYAFNLLNPGTVKLGKIQIVGQGLPVSVDVGATRILLSATLRGRP